MSLINCQVSGRFELHNCKSFRCFQHWDLFRRVLLDKCNRSSVCRVLSERCLPRCWLQMTDGRGWGFKCVPAIYMVRGLITSDNDLWGDLARQDVQLCPLWARIADMVYMPDWACPVCLCLGWTVTSEVHFHNQLKNAMPQVYPPLWIRISVCTFAQMHEYTDVDMFARGLLNVICICTFVGCEC